MNVYNFVTGITNKETLDFVCEVASTHRLLNEKSKEIQNVLKSEEKSNSLTHTTLVSCYVLWRPQKQTV